MPVSFAPVLADIDFQAPTAQRGISPPSLHVARPWS
jgi:hypothetical protein